eukprot:1682926-Rhodomonas_salina.3
MGKCQDYQAGKLKWTNMSVPELTFPTRFAVATCPEAVRTTTIGWRLKGDPTLPLLAGSCRTSRYEGEVTVCAKAFFRKRAKSSQAAERRMPSFMSATKRSVYLRPVVVGGQQCDRISCCRTRAAVGGDLWF